MFLQIILLVIGFVVLIKGADFFVEGARNIARKLHLSKVLVGLTIVAFGTSAPEFAVSIESMLNGAGAIILGNVIGSNILNILLILGICSIIHTLDVEKITAKKEMPLALLLTTALIILMNDTIFGGRENILTRGDSLILLLFFLVFLYYLITLTKSKIEDEDLKESILPLEKSSAYTILGIIAIILGSRTVVSSASNLATQLGITERIISLTIVAFGTSLPELVTSIVATKRKEYDIAIGNVIGSNIFNIGIVLALPILLFGNVPIITFNYLDLIFLFLSIFILQIFSMNKYKIKKIEGIILLIMFIIYYTLILI